MGTAGRLKVCSSRGLQDLQSDVHGPVGASRGEVRSASARFVIAIATSLCSSRLKAVARDDGVLQNFPNGVDLCDGRVALAESRKTCRINKYTRYLFFSV
jgi:hypothetical protein